MYYSNMLYKELNENFGTELIGQELTYRQISRRLNKIFKKDGIRVKIHKDSGYSANKKSKAQPYSFSGYYEPEKDELPITIFIHFSPNKDKFKFTKKNYPGFIFVFSQTVQHEMIHHSQFVFREEDAEKMVNVFHSDRLSKQRKNQINYLREWCEIEAYAHDIAMEINYYYQSDPPEKVFKNIDNLDKLITYRYYKQVFKGTGWSKVKKTLLRKVWRWIPVAHVPKFST